MHARNLAAHGVPLAGLGAEHHVLRVVALHAAVGGHHLHGQVVDVVELGELRLGGAGHAAQLGEGFEKRLVRHAGDGHRLVLNRQPLLRLDRLVQAVGPPAAFHRAAGELVHDHHLLALDDVRHVLELQVLRLDGVDDVQRPLRARVVKVRHLQEFLRRLVTLLGEQHALLLLVHGVVEVLLERVRDLRRLHVPLRGLVREAGDDERRARLVDQDAVHLVDDAKVEVAEHELGGGLRQVVSQVVEPELGVGDVRHVRAVPFPTLLLGHARLDQPAGQTEELVDLADPLRVAARQVVVHRHDVHALPGERVEERGQRGNEGLALARAHLRDLALVQDHAADELHVERAEPEHARRRLAHRREGFDEQSVQVGAVARALLQLRRLRAELVIRQSAHGGLHGVDRIHARLVPRLRLRGGVTLDRALHALLDLVEERVAAQRGAARGLDGAARRAPRRLRRRAAHGAARGEASGRDGGDRAHRAGFGGGGAACRRRRRSPAENVRHRWRIECAVPLTPTRREGAVRRRRRLGGLDLESSERDADGALGRERGRRCAGQSGQRWSHVSSQSATTAREKSDEIKIRATLRIPFFFMTGLSLWYLPLLQML